ncbi:hypothetical protein EJ02DRAFT_439586 [Clathrospora elynae]|uniref:Tat pathway signal sequence n=1 Tax=Clathrospora elynae TaxID=706981 RepID=A0A6A5S682_9PLEO|nr:hypothetical protein EJ02DRAFT_439586 [Clathrospora elynae]
MAMPREKQSYTPVSDVDVSSQSGSESEDLLFEGRFSRVQQRGSHLKRRLLFAFAGFVFLAAYTAVTVSITSMYWKKERLHGASVIDSPLRPYIRYEPTTFASTESSSSHDHSTTLVGHPSDEGDARWSKLMEYFFTSVPYEYMAKLERLDQGVQLPNGDYVANYAFMHQLHCVKRIYQGYFPERYFPNMTEEERGLQLEHNLHCLEMLIEGIKCKADETPLTLRWLDNTPLPTGNRSIAHECVNWDLITQGLEKGRVDPFVAGVFVHPKFGAVVPQGKNTVIENRIGFTADAKGLDYDKYPTHATHHD